MQNVKIKFKKLNPNVKDPLKASDSAAGYDMYACLPCDYVDIPPHCTIKIGTGVVMQIDPSYWGGLFARSGLATKEGLRPAKCVGVIDSDYRGEVIFAIHNDTDSWKKIFNNERIGQFLLFPKIGIIFEEVNKLSDTERGQGGFASTGLN